jgi:ribonuclease Z
VSKLIVLGSAASVPDAEHDTVSLALCGPGWAILIDCGGSPLHKLARVGVEMQDIRAIVLTHRHADHIYGMPMLIQGLWLGGREAPLPIYGPAETLDVVRSLLRLFNLSQRKSLFPLVWQPIPLCDGCPVMSVEGVQVSATPVDHGEVDTLALRFDNSATGRSLVYSADTEPCPGLVRLALGADILLHEATGELPGHSSPAQAAGIAYEAEVKQLVLIHYPVRGLSVEAWRQKASRFPGPVLLARDGDAYPL